jgi:hypothetical protein
MGQGKYKSIELSHVNRGVYMVTLPEIKDRSIEYYIEAETADGKK